MLITDYTIHKIGTVVTYRGDVEEFIVVVK
jgi:hypothetical protein